MTDIAPKNMSDAELGKALRACYIEMAEQFIDDNEQEVLEAGMDEGTVMSAWESESGETFDSASTDTAWIEKDKMVEEVFFEKNHVIVRLTLSFLLSETLMRPSDLGDRAVGRPVTWKFDRRCAVEIDPWSTDTPTYSFDVGKLNESIEGYEEVLI